MTSFLVILGIVYARFLAVFVLSYFILWKWAPNFFKKHKIQTVERQKPQVAFETQYSIITLFIQALVFWSIYQGAQAGFFNIYQGFAQFGLWKEVLAVTVYFIIYDAYFYWSHRFLHWGWFYKNVHVVHHKSMNPTPLASFSFHPIEAIASLLYIYVVLLLVPMSAETFIGLMLFTDFGNISGHLGYEYMPKKLITSRWGNWITTPTHHNMHHQVSKYNFGLYWNGWDKLFKTQHAKTDDEFLRVKSQQG